MLNPTLPNMHSHVQMSISWRCNSHDIPAVYKLFFQCYFWHVSHSSRSRHCIDCLYRFICRHQTLTYNGQTHTTIRIIFCVSVSNGVLLADFGGCSAQTRPLEPWSTRHRLQCFTNVSMTITVPENWKSHSLGSRSCWPPPTTSMKTSECLI